MSFTFEDIKKLKAENKVIVLEPNRKFAKHNTRQCFVLNLISQEALTAKEIIEKCLESQFFNSSKSISQTIYNLNTKKKAIGFFTQGNYCYIAIEKAKELGLEK